MLVVVEKRFFVGIGDYIFLEKGRGFVVWMMESRSRYFVVLKKGVVFYWVVNSWGGVIWF